MIGSESTMTTNAADRLLEQAGVAIRRQLRRVDPLVRWLASWPWWLQVGAIWLLGRLFTAWLFVIVANRQDSTPWSSAQPGYLEYSNGWDAGFFREIYQNGYPAVLPRDAAGLVDNNPWAFLPGYPFLVRGVSAITGLDWLVAAPMVSLLASLGFFLLAYRLFTPRFGHSTALVALAALSFAPASAIFQIPYSESVALVLVAAILLAWSRERYLLSIPLVLLAGLTRPLAAPLALASLLLIVSAWWQWRNGVRLSRGRWVSLAALAVVSVAAIGLWPAIAAAVTGVPNAYLLTEAAWHGGESQFPFKLYVRSMVTYFGPIVGVVVGIVAALVVIRALLARAVMSLGVVMWTWVLSCVAYLAVVVPVNTSLIRLLAPAFPLALAAAGASRSRAYRGLLLLGAAISQVVWMVFVWRWTGSNVQAP
ncbi:hypothetical protein ATK74_1962 [Propionicimonas paludicola]|uniref:Dolichyl-phosphate-mannose-protein mannosyltransferase n=1 Tax=Propionicimonas paludicola TaxID=185243 RepID=A0A2A9CSJ2_9ACTN|nr:hypothetical protein [Propionicimonas paludicola]PFG17394.1 hypothetical protein ATK74_1962 [Propionicimonas paludicola]